MVFVNGGEQDTGTQHVTVCVLSAFSSHTLEHLHGDHTHVHDHVFATMFMCMNMPLKFFKDRSMNTSTENVFLMTVVVREDIIGRMAMAQLVGARLHHA